MAKLREMIRSLRNKLPTKSPTTNKKSPNHGEVRACPSSKSKAGARKWSIWSTQSTLVELSPQPSYQNDASTLPDTPDSSLHAGTPPATPTKSRVGVVGEAFPATLSIDDDDGFEQQAAEQAEKAANFAILEFTRRLPLLELSSIGQGLDGMFPRFTCGPHNGNQARGTADSAGDLCIDSLSNLAELCSTNAYEPKELSQEPRCEPDNVSVWSFACQSARRLEREHEHDIPTVASSDAEHDASKPQAADKELPIEYASHENKINKHGEIENLPSTPEASSPTPLIKLKPLLSQRFSGLQSQPGDASSYGSLTGWGVGQSSIVPDLSSPTGRVLRSVEYSDAIPGAGSPIMSDKEFDDLPYYSDVEEAPEYNIYRKRRVRSLIVLPSSSVSAASSSTFSAKSLVVADVYVPGGNFGQFSIAGWMSAFESMGKAGKQEHEEEYLAHTPGQMRKREWEGVEDSGRKRRRLVEEGSCEMF